jgi:hypothetical protein
MGPTRAHVLSILLLGKLHSLGYSREVESRADVSHTVCCSKERARGVLALAR